MGIIAWVLLGLIAGMLQGLPPRGRPRRMIVTTRDRHRRRDRRRLHRRVGRLEGLETFFELRTWVIAILGSMLLLGIYRLSTRGRHAPLH